jgi:hypothetical protein
VIEITSVDIGSRRILKAAFRTVGRFQTGSGFANVIVADLIVMPSEIDHSRGHTG